MFMFSSHAHVAKSKKAYTIDDEHLKPCTIDICTEFFGKERATKIYKYLSISIDGHRSILENDIFSTYWFKE